MSQEALTAARSLHGKAIAGVTRAIGHQPSLPFQSLSDDINPDRKGASFGSPIFVLGDSHVELCACRRLCFGARLDEISQFHSFTVTSDSACIIL